MWDITRPIPAEFVIFSLAGTPVGAMQLNDSWALPNCDRAQLRGTWGGARKQLYPKFLVRMELPYANASLCASSDPVPRVFDWKASSSWHRRRGWARRPLV